MPKPDGRQRPIGIAAPEDKIVQQAVVTILHEIHEVDRRRFSYSFRLGRHAHQALHALSVGMIPPPHTPVPVTCLAHGCGGTWKRGRAVPNVEGTFVRKGDG